MSLFTTFPGMENPLVRRLQRHAQMTTIFHARPNHEPHGMNNAMTHTVSLEETGLPDLARHNVHAVRPAPASPDSMSAQPPKIEGTAVSPSPATSVQKTTDSEDKNWRRLQTIFNRHIVNASTEETTPGAGPVYPTQSDSIPASPGQQFDAPIQKASQPENPTAPSNSNAEPTPVSAKTTEPGVAASEISPERPQTKIQRTPERKDPSPGAANPQQKNEAGLTVSSSEPPGLQTAVAQPPTQKAAAPPAEISPSKIEQTHDNPAAETAALPSAAVLKNHPTENTETVTPDATVLPLEDVWPVSINQPISRQAAPQPPKPQSTPVSSKETAVLQQNAVQMKHLLKDVRSGQPSESQIELVAPRRPRPTAPGQPVQAKTETAEIPQKPTPPSKKQPSETPFEPALIPTEIGPLPADLWEIMEQPVPSDANPGDGEASAQLQVQRQEEMTANPSIDLKSRPTRSASTLNTPGQMVQPTLKPDHIDSSALPGDMAETSQGIEPGAETHVTQPLQQAKQPILQQLPVDLNADTTSVILSKQPGPSANQPAVQLSPGVAQNDEESSAIPAEPVTSSQKVANIPPDLGETGKIAEEQTAVLQRSPTSASIDAGEEIATSPQPELPETETQEEAEEPESALDLDMEALARQVYSQIKRRLAIDWERLRHS